MLRRGSVDTSFTFSLAVVPAGFPQHPPRVREAVIMICGGLAGCITASSLHWFAEKSWKQCQLCVWGVLGGQGSFSWNTENSCQSVHGGLVSAPPLVFNFISRAGSSSEAVMYHLSIILIRILSWSKELNLQPSHPLTAADAATVSLHALKNKYFASCKP